MADMMELERVKEWGEEYPREWWALEALPPEDPLRDDVVAAILQNRPGDPSIDQLLLYASALEVQERAVKAGTVKPAPDVGPRRPYEIHVIKMVKMLSMEKDLFFRVGFWTDEGWSGYFDTTNPRVVECVNKHKGEILTVIGEVERKLYDFLVVLGGRINIV